MFRVFDENDEEVGIASSWQGVLTLLKAPEARLIPLEDCEGYYTVYQDDTFFGSCHLDSTLPSKQQILNNG